MCLFWTLGYCTHMIMSWYFWIPRVLCYDGWGGSSQRNFTSAENAFMDGIPIPFPAWEPSLHDVISTWNCLLVKERVKVTIGTLMMSLHWLVIIEVGREESSLVVTCLFTLLMIKLRFKKNDLSKPTRTSQVHLNPMLLQNMPQMLLELPTNSIRAIP